MESFEDRRSALEELLAGMIGGSNVAAAEAYARGERCLRVVHGDPETAEDSRRQDALTSLVDQVILEEDAPGQWVRTVGTNDSTTFWFASSDAVPADVLVAAMAARVGEIAASWWRLSEEPL